MIALALGAIVGLGVVFIIAGFTPPDESVRSRRRHTVSPTDAAPYVIGVIAAAVMLVVSQWPIAAVGVGILTALATAAMIRPPSTPRAAEARLDALASWCEQLRDLLRAGALLTPAIATTAHTCGIEIQAAVTRLAARMEREDATVALRRFADEINDPTGDLIASVLATATTHSGNTAELLSELADLTRERVERRKSIEAERATTRLDMRIILGICTITIVGLMLLSRSRFLEPYRTLTGQVVLIGVFAALIVAVVWARRLAVYRQPDRFLTLGDRR